MRQKSVLFATLLVLAATSGRAQARTGDSDEEAPAAPAAAPAPTAPPAPAAAPAPYAAPAPVPYGAPAPAPYGAAPPPYPYGYPPPYGYGYGYPPPPPQPVAPPPPRPVFGLGYKMGNGGGLLGGDIIIDPIEHLSIDLSASYVSQDATYGGTATGFVLAPAIQLHFFKWPRSTPYLAAGPLYASLSWDGVSGSSLGGFCNGGYIWKWPGGFAIILGGGIRFAEKVTMTQTTGYSTEIMTWGGDPTFNLEFGLRYMVY